MGINVDRVSEVAPINVLWDDVSQKKGAGIRDQEIGHLSGHGHREIVALWHAVAQSQIARIFTSLDNCGGAKQTTTHEKTP